MDLTKLETELTVLRHVEWRRRLLEQPAALYAQHAPKECNGHCKEPTLVGSLGLTCCTLYMLYHDYHDALRMETIQRGRVERARISARPLS